MDGEKRNGGNGEHGVAGRAPAVITLTMDLETFHLDVKAAVPTLDFALGMLQQAQRSIEQQLRMAAAAQLQEQLRVQAENQRIAAALRKGN